MPPDPAPAPKPIDTVVDKVGLYPREAFEFVQEGLAYTVERAHGQVRDPQASRHVTGQMLCEGLRQFALMQWGMLARTVLARWNIEATLDFGRIVFAMIESGHMSKTDEDSLEDFRDVYDFRTAFDQGYKLGAQS
jgi:uncharacterized repeat protein (TIGR04138 family)